MPSGSCIDERVERYLRKESDVLLTWESCSDGFCLERSPHYSEAHGVTYIHRDGPRFPSDVTKGALILVPRSEKRHPVSFSGKELAHLFTRLTSARSEEDVLQVSGVFGALRSSLSYPDGEVGYFFECDSLGAWKMLVATLRAIFALQGSIAQGEPARHLVPWGRGSKQMFEFRDALGTIRALATGASDVERARSSLTWLLNGWTTSSLTLSSTHARCFENGQIVIRHEPRDLHSLIWLVVVEVISRQGDTRLRLAQCPEENCRRWDHERDMRRHKVVGAVPSRFEFWHENCYRAFKRREGTERKALDKGGGYAARPGARKKRADST